MKYLWRFLRKFSRHLKATKRGLFLGVSEGSLANDFLRMCEDYHAWIFTIFLRNIETISGEFLRNFNGHLKISSSAFFRKFQWILWDFRAEIYWESFPHYLKWIFLGFLSGIFKDCQTRSFKGVSEGSLEDTRLWFF